MHARLGRSSLVLCLIVAALFVAFKLQTLAPRFSDGHTYSYMGWLITQGFLPYIDFYYSSPPLLPYLFALMHGVFDWSWCSDLMIPLLFTGLDVLVLAFIPWPKHNRFPAVAASLSFLFSFCTLATTDFASDGHLLTFLMLLGLLFILRGWAFSAGIALGLCGLVKVYGHLGSIGILLSLCYLRQWRAMRSFILGLAISFGLVCVGFWLWLGPTFVNQVLMNNLGRLVSFDKLSIVSFFAAHDPLLCIALLFPPLLALWPRFGSLSRELSFIPNSMLFVLIIFYLFYNDLYYLYFLPACALIAVLIGLAVSSLEMRSMRIGVFALLVLSSLFTTYSYWQGQAKAAVIDSLDALVNRLISITTEGEAIYGDSEFTPLVARLANRPIARNFIDTNIKFFNQGIFRFEDRLVALKESNVGIILTKATVSSDFTIIDGPERVLPREYFARECKVDSVWPIAQDYSSNAILIWNCRKASVSKN